MEKLLFWEIAINAKHYDGTFEYEVHNIFCIAEIKLSFFFKL